MSSVKSSTALTRSTRGARWRRGWRKCRVAAMPNASGNVRAAVVGVGRMGRQHLRAIKQLSDVAQLVGCVDPDPVARAATGMDAIVYRSLDELIPSASPDVVHICTPVGTHGELAMAAVQRGCHVYVEKPVAEK